MHRSIRAFPWAVAAGTILAAVVSTTTWAGPGDIVITEIMYEARTQQYSLNLDPAKGGYWWETGDEPEAEYVELYNRGLTTVNLQDWEFVEGIFFTFPNVSMPPDTYLVVCADAATITSHYGISNVVGNYTGELANNNHRITLVDDSEPPVVIDTVRYRDDPPWPLAPDQDGRSLELMDPFEDNSGPENWRASRVPIELAADVIPPETPEWQFVSATGTATSDRFYFYLQAAGEWLIDDVQLRPAGGGANVFSNPSFEGGDAGWEKTGNHAGTLHTTEDSRAGFGAEKIIATGAGSSSSNSLQQGNLPVVTQQQYTLTCWLKRLSGSSTLTFRFSGSGLLTEVEAAGLGRPDVGDRQEIHGGTPGEENTVFRTDGLPPFVTDIEHSVLRPTSSDSVDITARVTAEAALADVTLHYEYYTRPFPYFAPSFVDSVPMEEIESKVFLATIPPTGESQTLVRYRVEAEDVEGRSWIYPDDFALSPHRAYFAYDGEEDTELPLYHLIFSQPDFFTLNSDVFSKNTVDATIVVDGITYDHVKVRYRGCRQCPKKSHKIKFNRHEYLREMRTLDFDHDYPVSQGVWSSLFWLVGQDNIASEPARLIRNGQFYGVFLTQESPNRSWLERHGRDPDTEIYKAKSSGGQLNGVPGFDANLIYHANLADYPLMYIRRGDSLESFVNLQTFSRSLAQTSNSLLPSYMENNMFLNDWLYRWTLHTTAPHCDFHNKNYYIMRTSEGVWDVVYFDYDRFWGCLFFPMGANDRPCHSINTDPFCSGNLANWSIRDNTTLRREYLKRLRDVVENILVEENVIPRLDRAFERTILDRSEELSGVTGVGSAVAPDLNLPEMRQYFTDRRNYLLGWLNTQNVPDLPNDPPSITVEDPVTFEPGEGKPVLIQWNYSDPEGDSVVVDLYWTDLAFSLLQPIAFDIPADDGQYAWLEGTPLDNARDVYIQAVARDDSSPFVGRHTSIDPIRAFSNEADAQFAPVMSPMGGSFVDEQQVTLTAEAGWDVYYTLDGTDPRVSNTRILYQGPITVTASSVLRSVAVRTGSGGGPGDPSLLVWDLSDDWSNSSNPNDVWRYADGTGNTITNNISNWMSLGQAWAEDASSTSGWGRRISTHPTLDLPAGRVFMHSPSTVVWTSPITGEIEIDGGYWMAADNGNRATWTLRQNNSFITAQASLTRASGNSASPAPLSGGNGGSAALTRVVVEGDTIEFKVIASGTDDELGGVDLRITHQLDIPPPPDIDLEFSPVVEATFTRPPTDFSGLKISEIMYNPIGGSELEFLEFYNAGPTEIDLFGVQVTNGIAFGFRPNTVLMPGEYLVLASDLNVFEIVYPGVPVHGQHLGSLSNGGEKVTVQDATMTTILSVDYNDSGFWQIAPDGFGRSLVLDDLSGDPDRPASWRASASIGGSPGGPDPALIDQGVVINEVIVRGESPLEDAIELLNVSNSAVDVGGWFLSDSRDTEEDLKKYSIPLNTFLDRGEFLVVYEVDFNASPGSPSSFDLAAGGGSVFLSSATSSGDLTGYVIEREYFASPVDQSFGTYETSVEPVFTALTSRTFGADNPSTVEEFRTGTGTTNADPVIGPVIFNEIFYHPPDPGMGNEAESEFIEFFNVTGSTIPLFDDALGAGWLVDGVSAPGGAGEFEFPPGAEIAPGSFLLLVPVDPIAFRSQHSIPAEIPVVGPFGGAVDNSGERLKLFRPLVADGINIAYELIDEVRYNDRAPWPTTPDGMGPSLERIAVIDYGNDPVNWAASGLDGGTPGGANSVSDPNFNFPPESDFSFVLIGDLTVSFDASASSDRNGTIDFYDWNFGDGEFGSGETIEHTFPGEGTYLVELSVTDDEDASTSSLREVTIVLPFQRPGDANQDTVLTIVDALVLLHLLFDPAGISLPCADATAADGGNATLLDFDASSQVTLGDAVQTLQHLYLGGPAHALGVECAGIAGCDDVCR